MDVRSITDVSIEHGDLHPRIVVVADKRYEFVLSKGRELYDRLREIPKNPLGQRRDGETCREIACSC